MLLRLKVNFELLKTMFSHKMNFEIIQFLIIASKGHNDNQVKKVLKVCYLKLFLNTNPLNFSYFMHFIF